MSQPSPGTLRRYAPWALAGVVLFALHSTLAAMDAQFGYDVYVEDMPVPALVGILVCAGLVFLGLPWLTRTTEGNRPIDSVYLLTWIFIAGLAMRMVFLGTQPILEDDYNRYLLDGAVTAHGINPYAHSPEEIFDRNTGNQGLERIADDAGVILERINYPGLKTVYPPVAQLGFALAHWLEPWSLDAWRIVLLIGDIAVFALVFILLLSVGRAPVWIALYWWNPVVVKELHNSTHMDLLVVIAVAGALLLTVRSRPATASAAIAVGIGAKIWPVLLLPTLWRPLVSTPRVLAAAVLMAAVLSAVLLAPVILSGLNETSGFVAYGSRWQANDALFRAIEWVFLQAASALGAEASAGKLMARGLVATTLCAIALYINRTPPKSPLETCRRVFVVIGALLLLSPTQFPWYYTWLAVLLPLFPVRGFVILAATLPLYYTYFYLAARDMSDYFRYGVVLIIWLPAWVLLAHDYWRQTKTPHPARV